MELNLAKHFRWFLKYTVQYFPHRKRSMYLSEPNLIYGLSDHPLDKNAAPFFDLFSLFRKYIARKPISILRVEFIQRHENTFIFRAFGYDIMRKRDLSVMHMKYQTGKNVRNTAYCLQLDILTPKTYRLRLAKGDRVPDHATPMVCANITDESLIADFEEIPDRYVISTPLMSLHIFKQDFRIMIYDREGKLITETGSRTHNEFPNTNDAFPLGFVRNLYPRVDYATENFNLFPAESIFGLGEKFGAMNRIGQTISLWHLEGLGNTSARAYKHIPFFMSSRGYGVFFNDYNPMTFWVGSREVSKVIVGIENDLLDYYFFYGPTPKEILLAYTGLTGRAAVPPRWSLGTWMSRLSYSSQKEVLNVAKRLRRERFPCDVIHIDTNWFTKEWACDYKFDEARFPDPESMFRECQDLGFKLSLWQIPYVVDELDISTEGKNRGAFAENNGPFLFEFPSVGPAHVIDFSKPEGIAWYQEKIKHLFELGARVIKVDFGEQIEPHQKFAGYTGRQMHNLYPLLYNQAAFEISQEYFGQDNAVIWARSAYAGSQRFPVHWSGDNSSNYANMLCSLRGGLSLGLCGFTFWSQDVGGFVGIPDDKLYLRWTALSVLQSHIRFHGCAPKYREPWNFSEETQQIARKLLEFRYRLIPYLYSESIKAARKGLPLMRALFVEAPDDPCCFYIEDQFFSGEVLLVAPILTGEDVREVYLPRGRWYNFWTGEEWEGPARIQQACPLEEIPLFVKAGTFLVLGEVMQYVSDGVPDKLTLASFPDDAGSLAYTLHDEVGTIAFRGLLKEQTLVVNVSCMPADRPKPEIEVRLLLKDDSVKIEIVME